MIRRHLMALRLCLMFVDAVSATAVFLLVSLARFGDGEWMAIWQRNGIDIRVASVSFGVLWITAMWYHGLYRLRARWRLRTEATDIVRATMLVAALTLVTLYLANYDNVSRLFLLGLFASQALVALVGRALLRASFGHLRSRGYNTHYLLVVGTQSQAQRFADKVEGRSALGIRVIGHLAAPGEQPCDLTRPTLGTLDDIQRVFHTRVVDELAVCLSPQAARYLDPITRVAADEGKTVRVPRDSTEPAPPGTREEEFEGMTVRSFVHDGQHELGLATKRFVDVLMSAVGLVLLSPLLLVVALAIRSSEGKPILFHQTRVGLHGRQFTITKFRTMVPDAEERYAEIEALSDTRGAAFKMVNDPRVTKLGKFLRRSSIDELPQLINVLRGDMSLIGPRPAPPREVAGYDIWQRRRLSMKPGISGLWQVASRLDDNFDQRARLDLEYIDRWSLGLDLRILLRTVPAVLRATGR